MGFDIIMRSWNELLRWSSEILNSKQLEIMSYEVKKKKKD